MLKKLYRKFVLINMALVGVAVFFIFTALCLLSYRTEKAEIIRTLEQITQPGGHFFPHKDGIPMLGGKEPLPYVSAFSVAVDKNGRLLQSEAFGAIMEEETLAEAIEAVLLSPENEGTVGTELIYVKQESPLGYRIAFASTEHLNTTMKNTVIIAGVACMLSLLIFYFVSRFLARLAIRPIETAWKQQQQFVADASHDLKTPLTVILADLDILKKHRDESVASQMQWIESTAQEAQRMHGLTCKLLELAKSEDTAQALLFSETDLSELCERVLLQFEPVAFENGVSLVGEIEENIRIKSNEEAMIRLLHILIDNALKYSPHGGKATVSLTAKKSICFTVRNEGVISPDDLPHIFERFYRADAARSAGSFGLGLSIAKNLAESLGAELTAESDEQNGTSFILTLRRR